MSKDDIQRLRTCIEMLDRYEGPLREGIEEGGQAEESPTVILPLTFAFGRITLDGMLAVVEKGGDCGSCAATLCRPFYELATRVLWASREPDGWRRLHLMWEKANRAQHREASKLPNPGPLSQRILDRANDRLNRAAADGIKPAPDMQRTLTDIASRDRDDGVLDSESPKYEYTGLWRSMSMYAHSHISLIVRASQTLRRLGTGAAVVATWALLRAMAEATSPDRPSRDKMITDITTRMIEMVPRVGDAD